MLVQRTIPHVLNRPIQYPALCFMCRRRLYTKNIVKEGDTVLLKSRRDSKASPVLTKPLKTNGAPIYIGGSPIEQADLVGKQLLDVVQTKKGYWRIHLPTLAEYVSLTPRLVTPVYPVDANLIVSLLDLHLSTTENSDEDSPLEIFEAGTGHGSLTLYLARAINGANPPAPPPPRVKHFLEETQSHRPDDKTQDPSPDLNNSLANEKPRLGQDPSAPDRGFHAYESYLPRRRAIIQSLDISPRFSEQAQRTVRNFRRGMYYHNVDFHVGTIPSYLSARLASSPSPFLEHAILDLPNCHEFLEIINQSLKPNGTLMVFCPSITQINTCVQFAKKLFLPWKLETTLELGIGAGVGGREWDVRFIKPRALLKAELESKTRLEYEQQRSAVEIIDVGEDNGNREIIDEKMDDGLKMVCRPKVGARVTGGGFLAQWRKLS